MNAVALIEAMEAEGLSADAIIRVLKASDKKQDRTNAERQARHRAKKARSNAVTVTPNPPPIEDHTPHSVSNETAAEPLNLAKQMFDMGLAMLASQGIPEQRGRSIIGKWRKGRSPGDVVAALIDAQAQSISNLVEWMPKRLSGKRNGDPPSYLDHLIEQKLAANG